MKRCVACVLKLPQGAEINTEDILSHGCEGDCQDPGHVPSSYREGQTR